MKDPDDCQRFLEIITRQANRLNSIIEDLLTLSRIEQGAEVGQIDMVQDNISDIMQAAVQSCEIKAASKDITLNIDCDKSFKANVNRRLMEHKQGDAVAVT